MDETRENVALGYLAEGAACGVAYQLVQARPLVVDGLLVVGFLYKVAQL